MMKMDRKQKSLKMRDERGFITLDFIFALFMSLGFAIVFFSVSITLSLIEAAQYVTFTTSRAYMAAHENKTLQNDLGQAKFKEVMGKSAFKTFLGQNWFKLGTPELGDFTSDYPEDETKDNAIFVGARIAMNAELLHLRIPFLGSTAEDSGVGKATLNSYLMREVSTEECREGFNRMRYQKIRELSSSGGGSYSSAPSANAKIITDNGC